MQHPYYTAAHAWRFVLVLHRLSPLEIPLRISPAAGTSMNTVRMKLFQGRQFIFETTDVSLARYHKLSLNTCISTHQNTITLEKLEDFDSAYSDLKQDSFSIIFQSILHQLTKPEKAFSISFSPHELASPQAKALREYLMNYPAVKFCQLTSTSVMIGR